MFSECPLPPRSPNKTNRKEALTNFYCHFFPMLGLRWWKKLTAKLAKQALPWNTYTAPGQDFAFLHRVFLHTGVAANVPDSAMTFMDQTSLSFQTHRTYIQRNDTVKWGQSLTLTTVSTMKRFWGRRAYKSDHYLGFTQHGPHRTCSFSLKLVSKNVCLTCLKDHGGQGSSMYSFFISHLLTTFLS